MPTSLKHRGCREHFSESALISFALAVLVSLAFASPTFAKGGKQKPTTAKQQIEFGVEMAELGLWSEALFRFRQAESLDPGKSRTFNNLAVASEALGLFEEALDYYRKALKQDPSNRGLKRNYARFVEFYQSFKPEEEAEDDSGGKPENATT